MRPVPLQDQSSLGRGLRRIKFFIAAILALWPCLEISRAATIAMNGSDALNTSSFNSGLHWTGGQAPVATNACQTANFLLRTPANATAITFAGGSLEVQNGGSLRDKTAALVTITNLILDGGSTLELTQPNNVNNATAAGSLTGTNITLNGTVTIHAGLGTDVPGETLTINAPISGTGGITTAGSSGNLILTATNTFSGGVTVGGGGTLTISGGVGGPANVIVGSSAGNSVLNLSGPITPNFLIVGNANNSVGAAYQTGGTINDGVVSGYENLSLGNVPGSFGYFDAAGGTFPVYGIAIAGEENNGTTSSFNVAGNGIFEVNGGTVNNTGWIVIARESVAASGEIGVLNVFSGSLTYAAGGIVGPWDTGETAIINVLGGSVSNLSNIGVYLGSAGNTGILNLNGGQLEASIITGFNGPTFSVVQYGQLNFNGGTLQAYTANASFIQVSTATIYGSGATIDNNGDAITVSQPLLAPAGNGIYSIASFTGGTGYIAPPIIIVTNAAGDTSGFGATAVAQINPLSGTVTNIIITCPGQNYTATPVFLVSGGGATTPATVTGNALTPNPATGGLTAIGSGALTLAATNTYLGSTIVTNGTVLLTGAVAGGMAVAGGGTLIGNGNIGGALTNRAGGTLQPGLGNGDTSTLSVSNNVVLAGTNYFVLNRANTQNSSRIYASGAVTFGGTLTVANAGSALQAGDTFTLFSAAGFTGNFSTANLPGLSFGLTWTNTLTQGGTISILSSLPPTNVVVTNLPASQIFATSATLNGQVLATGGQIPAVWIYYGPNDGGTNIVAWSNSISLGPKNTTFNTVATALATNTTYYFATAASNSAGISWATPSLSFKTLVQNPAAVRVPMLTYHNDNSRQGQNTNETLLTAANVNTNTFGKLFSYTVDGYVYSQPLVMTNVTIPGQGVHDVVFISTEHDTVYAFDADSNTGTNGGLLWKTNLGLASLNSLSPYGRRYTGVNPYTDITPEVGATGTPVIDPITGTLYVNSFTREVTGGTTNFVHRIHALDVATGNERPYSPVVVTGSVPGTGVDSSNGVVSFNPMQSNQRPALALVGGRLYATYAGYADTDPYHGWLFGFNATNLVLQTNYMFNTTPNANTGAFGSHAAEGGIWQGGGGLVADTNNNLFFETGNGSFSANTNGGDYADSFMKISTTNGLAIADYFTPYDQATLAQNDTDLGSCGPLLLPDSAGSAAHPHLLAGLGKSGKIYLIDRDTMASPHYQSGSDSQIVQSFIATPTGIWSPPTYFNNTLYVQPSSGPMVSYRITNAVINTTATTTAPASFGQFNGGPVVSANGTNNGIVWVLNSAAFASSGAGVLYAFNATNISQMLYNSSQLATRDNPGGAVKMTTPTVAGGKVYVPAEYTLSVYGVQLFLDTPVIAPNGGSFVNSVNIAISDASAGTSIYFTLDGTTPTANSALYNGPFTLTSNAVVQAVAIAPGAVNSAIASASFVNTAAPGTGTGLRAEYFANATSANPFAGSPVLVQTNPTVNFTLTTNWPGALVGSNNFAVRWTGSVQPQFTETYSFITTADDGVRLYLNGQLLINDWVDKINSTSQTNTISLVAQQFYTIELDYYQKTNNASVALSWSSPSTPLNIVPQSQLYPFTNPPPTVVLTAPANAATYTASASVTVIADADAPNNPVSSVSFYANTNFLGSVSDVPYALTATGLTAGSYVLTAVATDTSGLSSTSAVANITVNTGSGQPCGLTNNPGVNAFLNMPTTSAGSIPAQLSLTGVFSNTPAMIVNSGLISYAPNTPLWSDGALKTRYVAVPNNGGVITENEQITFSPTNYWTFPAGTVFVKTFQLNTDTSNPNALRRLETRLLVRDINGAVYGVTYKWRPDNSDADLLSSSLTENITITNTGGTATQTWYYPSPSDCLTCHTPVANYVLGLNARQLNGNLTYPATGVADNQLRTWNRLGLFNPAFDESGITNFPRLSALTNVAASFEERSRSYLDANCAQCHQPGGSGITFDARYTTPLANQNLTNYPAAVSLGFDGACVVKPQDVWRSMIWQRINTTNNTVKMPPLARNLVDSNAVAVIGAWINNLPGTPAEAPPSITPNGGNYFSSVGVVLSAPDTNAAIYYTLDGSLPTTNSLLYSGVFNLTTNATIAASAWRTNYNNSVAASALFFVTPLYFTSAGFLTNQQFQLNFLGMPGSNYVLQATTNLVNWTPISTNTATTNAFNLLDPKATNYPRRFYRVLQQ